MDGQTRDKWLRVKQALEQSGKTNCLYYKLAIEALGKNAQFERASVEEIRGNAQG